eukprot:TRINITY_DN91950_c0_g1_i1.p2 TRINITY_DN91950_c0_g1~~TRINITY_DN91950_c0_g1_i1.p2  ORF type:complete len:118 (+),score=14.10 TRINITY_DN91950_c0_g1_i1:370-723(+)
MCSHSRLKDMLTSMIRKVLVPLYLELDETGARLLNHLKMIEEVPPIQRTEGLGADAVRQVRQHGVYQEPANLNVPPAEICVEVWQNHSEVAQLLFEVEETLSTLVCRRHDASIRVRE